MENTISTIPKKIPFREGVYSPKSSIRGLPQNKDKGAACTAPLSCTFVSSLPVPRLRPRHPTSKAGAEEEAVPRDAEEAGEVPRPEEAAVEEAVRTAAASGPTSPRWRLRHPSGGHGGDADGDTGAGEEEPPEPRQPVHRSTWPAAGKSGVSS